MVGTRRFAQAILSKLGSASKLVPPAPPVTRYKKEAVVKQVGPPADGHLLHQHTHAAHASCMSEGEGCPTMQACGRWYAQTPPLMQWVPRAMHHAEKGGMHRDGTSEQLHSTSSTHGTHCMWCTSACCACLCVHFRRMRRLVCWPPPAASPLPHGGVLACAYRAPRAGPLLATPIPSCCLICWPRCTSSPAKAQAACSLSQCLG